MVIRAHTAEGEPIQVSMPSWFAWLAGILASIITITVVGTAAKLVDLENRVVVIEASRFTTDDARDYVTIREFDGTILSLQTQLTRIESKIDRLQEIRP